MTHNAGFYFKYNYCNSCETKIAKDPAQPFKVMMCPACGFKMRLFPRGSKYKAKYKIWRKSLGWR